MNTMEDMIKNRVLLKPDCPYHIKKFQSCNGLEGRAYSGDLYRHNKRVGWFNDDGNGGCVNVRFLSRGLEKQFFATIAELGFKDQFEPEGTFIAELSNLHDIIRRFRRKCKTHLLIVAGDRLVSSPLLSAGWKRTFAFVKEPADYVLNEFVEEGW